MKYLKNIKFKPYRWIEQWKNVELTKKDKFVITVYSKYLTLSALIIAAIFIFKLLKVEGSSTSSSKAVNVYIYHPESHGDHVDSVEVSSFSELHSKNTNYERYGHLIARSLRANFGGEKFRVTGVPSNGGLHTLLQIERDAVNDSISGSLGIVQADVLYHYFNSRHPHFPIERSKSNVRAVSRLFREWVMVYHNKLPVDELNEEVLNSSNIRVVSRRSGSGSLATAMNIKNIMDYPWQSIDRTDNLGLNFSLSDSGITDASITQQDAVALVQVTVPDKTDKDKKKFIGLDRKAAQIVSSALPKIYTYIGTDSLLNYYNNKYVVANRRATIGVDAILIASKDTDEEIIRYLHNQIRTYANHKNDIDSLSLSEDQKKFFDIVKDKLPTKIISEESGNLPINRHISVIKDELDSFSVFLGRILDTQVLVLIAVFFFILVILRQLMPVLWFLALHKNLSPWSKWRYLFSNSINVILIFIGAVVVHAAIVVLIWASEYQYASINVIDSPLIKKGGVSEVFWWLMEFLVIKNPEIQLQSSMSLLWIGVLESSYAVFGIVATLIFSEKVFNNIKNKSMRDHIVIIGWRKGVTFKTLKELKNGEELMKDKPTSIKVVGPYPADEIKIPEEFADCYHRFTDFEENFKEVNLQHAKSIVIVTDSEDSKDGPNESDFQTLSNLSFVKKYLSDWDKKSISERKKNGQGPDIIVQIKKPENIQLAKEIGAHEVICIPDTTSKLIAQSALKPGLGSSIMELLTSKKEDNEIYYEDISKLFVNENRLPFSEVCSRFINKNFQKKGQNKIIPIGLHPISILRGNGSRKQVDSPVNMAPTMVVERQSNFNSSNKLNPGNNFMVDRDKWKLIIISNTGKLRS